jgi:hypothetical protein
LRRSDQGRRADWIIDFGPEGGGGEIVAAGMSEDIVREKRSYTGAFLKPALARVAASVGRRRNALRRRSERGFLQAHTAMPVTKSLRGIKRAQFQSIVAISISRRDCARSDRRI